MTVDFEKDFAFFWILLCLVAVMILLVSPVNHFELLMGTYSTKTISEVSGTGRKPYRQKRTGQARYARSFAFFYTIGLHILVFTCLYRMPALSYLSHGEAFDGDKKLDLPHAL